MVEEKKNIPKVRFREFAGDDANAWELRKLGGIGKVKSGVGFPNSEQGGKTGIPFFKVSDMNRLGNENELINADNYVTEEQVEHKKWKVIDEVPAIIFAKVGAAIMLNRKRIAKYKFLMDNNVMAYSFSNCWDTYFGKSLFETIFLPKYAQVGALPSYNSSDIESINVRLPGLQEQEKIGTFFKHLDELITLHQRELDNYKTLKKTMLSKMFPKNDEKYPEIRFTGFADAWEQRKLGEIVEWSKGSGLSKDALNIQGIGVPVIHYADLYKFNSVQKEVIHWTMNDIGTKIPENNLLFPMSDVTPDGLARTSTVLQSNVKAGGDVLIAKLNKDILSTFMSYQINRNKNQILPLVTGTTVRHINSKSLSTLKVTVPGKNEQKYVGSILMRFDSLIALHQRELESLKTLKKNLLQQMFV